MTVQELTDKLGLKDTDAEYKKIHELYLNSLSKLIDEDIFCVDYMNIRDSIIMDDLYEEYQEYKVLFKESSAALRDSASAQVSAGTLAMATAEMLIRKADEHMDEELYDTAINLIGIDACMAYKLTHDMELTKQDKEYILKVLKDGE